MRLVPELLEAAPRVIDLGGDFRLQSAQEYEASYRRPHTAAHLLPDAVYGLPEIHREKIAAARLVANPGCYPTSAILPLFPLLKAGLIAPEGIVVNSLSGVSGAGRSSSVEMSFTEVNETARAYKLGVHQHNPEIRAALGVAAGRAVSLSFVPHLIPITRGILTTTHASLRQDATDKEARECLAAFYAGAPFVRIRESIPEIRDVAWTNYCDIGCALEPRTRQLILVSAIDNLIKGAAGQAIQNMNIQFGIPEETGLL
jgi:N-acetyl-gamma-glutamyl-phosphate reductase